MPAKYRLTGLTLVMYVEDGRHIGRLLPDGATIITDGKKFNGEKLLDITWNDKPMMMFTQDVKKRGTLIE
jgi:hypothetical protein